MSAFLRIQLVQNHSMTSPRFMICLHFWFVNAEHPTCSHFSHRKHWMLMSSSVHNTVQEGQIESVVGLGSILSGISQAVGIMQYNYRI